MTMREHAHADRWRISQTAHVECQKTHANLVALKQFAQRWNGINRLALVTRAGMHISSPEYSTSYTGDPLYHHVKQLMYTVRVD